MTKDLRIIRKIFFRRKKKIKITQKNNKKEFIENKEKAKSLATERLIYFNEFYNLKYNRVTIKNTKSRWGSCSRKGNLNFNYKIALLPTFLSDYIIVHELCHIEQFNHSKDFWNLVARAIPYYPQARAELRKIKI
jgi:hypothetical protein